MNILVTGASGFIGSRLSVVLAGEGTHTVYALVREGGKRDGFGASVLPVIHDGTVETLIASLQKLEIGGIVHLASLFLAQHTPADIDRLIAANLQFGTQLIEAASVTGVNWFINTSSFWQHYGNRGYSPVALYAATKQAFEDILQYYRETAAVKIVTLELFDTYGPGDTRPKLLNLLRQQLDNPVPLAMSPGEQRMNLLHIDDVIAAFTRLVGLLQQGALLAEKYAASAAELPTLREVAALFGFIAGREIPIEWGGRPYRPREFMNPEPVYPPVPGWQQTIPLDEGIARTLRSDGVLCHG